MFEEMKDRWKKSKAVVEDLKTLQFKLSISEPNSNKKLYTISHPENKYRIWTANGFWFISIYELGYRDVFYESIGKFGFFGKVLVWWYARPHIKRLLEEKKKNYVSNFKKFW